MKALRAVIAWLRVEPITVINGAIGAGLLAAATFGLHLTDSQQTAVYAVVALLLALVGRQFVAPTVTRTMKVAKTTGGVVRRLIPEIVVEGKRLGRHVEHDARSLLHQVPKSDPPTSAILWPRQIPILNQGNLGSCTGNATVGSLGTQPNYAPLTALLAAGLTLDEAEAVLIYSDAEKLDGGKGYPPEDQGSSGLSVAKVAKTLGLIAGYLHATSVAACFTAIKVGPFIVGVDWYTGMDTPNANGLVTATGTVRGGHEFVIRGYDPTTDLWTADNSWGTSYGVDGSFTFSTATLTKLLADQGDATMFLPLGNAPAPVPTPTPTPAPTSVDAALAAALHRVAGTTAEPTYLRAAAAAWLTETGQ